jgi:hypothetical protein
MGRVSRSRHLNTSLHSIDAFSRLKPSARRSHLGPTGKKKAGTAQKKSMRRRELMFENAGVITTRGIPLVLAQSNEAVRTQTLQWVSTRQFLCHFNG